MFETVNQVSTNNEYEVIVEERRLITVRIRGDEVNNFTEEGIKRLAVEYVEGSQKSTKTIEFDLVDEEIESTVARQISTILNESGDGKVFVGAL